MAPELTSPRFGEVDAPADLVRTPTASFTAYSWERFRELARISLFTCDETPETLAEPQLPFDPTVAS